MVDFRWRAHLLSWVLISWIAWVSQAWGNSLNLPESLASESLSEAVPTAFIPSGAVAAPELSDFEVSWEGKILPGVQLELEQGSLQWVRVAETLVLPRARLRVIAYGVSAGRVSFSGFSQSLSEMKGRREGRFPISLLSGEEFPIEVQLIREGREVQGKASVRFRPRDGLDRVFLDSSCSRYHLNAELTHQSQGRRRWAYLGCRQQVMGAASQRTAALEIYFFWDQAGAEIRVDGVTTHSTVPSLWPLRLSAAPGRVDFEAGQAKDQSGIRVQYAIPDRLNLGTLGMGLGPYTYAFAGPGGSVDHLSPILTLYGSYFLTESVRLVAFDATALSQYGSTDFGIYLNTENFRIIDRRLTINFLLGGHALAFALDGQTYLLPGAPQGVEMIYADAFKRGSNLSLGGFVYPLINGKEYYNVWLRWGGRVFAEVNYISWSEVIHEQSISSRSLGLTLGFPLVQFF